MCFKYLYSLNFSNTHILIYINKILRIKYKYNNKYNTKFWGNKIMQPLKTKGCNNKERKEKGEKISKGDML